MTNMRKPAGGTGGLRAMPSAAFKSFIPIMSVCTQVCEGVSLLFVISCLLTSYRPPSSRVSRLVSVSQTVLCFDGIRPCSSTRASSLMPYAHLYFGLVAPLMVSKPGKSPLGRRPGPHLPRRLAPLVCVILVPGVVLSPPLTSIMSCIQRRFPPLLVNWIVAIVVFVAVIVIVSGDKVFDIRVLGRIYRYGLVPTLFDCRRRLLSRLHAIKNHCFVLA